MIPLMKKKFVDELGWLDEGDMLDIAALAQSSPGAMAVNAAILTGWRVLGALGALVGVLGTILPPFIILSVVSLFYTRFRDNPVVHSVLKGMMAGVCAVIFDVVMTMGGRMIRAGKLFPLLILAGAFTAYFVFGVNIINIILFCGVLGALLSLRGKKTGKERR